jgi:hypothetical protein
MLKRQLNWRAHTLFVSFYWLRNAVEKCSALKTSGPRHHQLCFPAEVDCDSPASLRLINLALRRPMQGDRRLAVHGELGTRMDERR